MFVNGGPRVPQAKSFEGSRAGFVFKMGPDGLGYYPDAAGKPRETGTPKRGPVTVAGGGSGGDGAANGGRRVVGRVPEGRKGGGDQGGDGSDSEGDADGARMMELAAKGVEQGRLIQAAFAGDDVEAEFAAEKAKEVEGELPKVDVPAVMPGWGKWSSDQKEPR